METGDRIGVFEILVPLQAGGMGEIYLAEDMRTCRKVAIKVLPPEHRENPFMIQCFQAEADLYRTLSHPNVIRYLDSGTYQGRTYVALEYIQGQDLSELLKDLGPIPLDMALSMLLDVSFALSFAHSKGIIHRDIKPHNVMLTSQNVIKLIDFGIAQTTQESTYRGSGMVVGSLCYASPEQNHGRDVDERSDIYSLGLLFYELLTGARVLKGKTLPAIIMEQVELDKQLPPPSQIIEDIPPELEELILRMIRYSPERRPNNMAEILEVLQGMASGNVSDLSGAQRSVKKVAERDLADTHYWKAMNAMAEQKWIESLTEFEIILNLSLFDQNKFQKQVEEQLHFLSWKIEGDLDNPQSSPGELEDLLGDGGEDLSDLQVDVLQKLQKIYTINPHEGIRSAMSNLLSFYRDRLREDPGGRRAAQEATHVDANTFVEILIRLSRLYGKIGNQNQRRIVEHKLVTYLGQLPPKEQQRELWERVLRQRSEQPILLEGYANHLAAQGRPDLERETRENLARCLERREDLAPALKVWEGLLEQHPGDAALKDNLQRVQEAFEDASEQAEKLISLLSRLEISQDQASAMNLCKRFLDEHPENLKVQEKLYRLQLSQGMETESAETLVQIGKIYFDRGDRTSARELFVEALRLSPRRSDAINFLVAILQAEDPSLCDRSSPKEVRRELYVRLGMAEQASKDLRKKLRRSPGDRLTLARLEEVYRRCKKTSEAAETCRDRVASVLQEGDTREARRIAEEFRMRYPEFRELLRPLASLPAVIRDPELVSILVHG
jgi:serine/threonine protein kinase/cytochrome c-type biogenesis protein CcmH/NrfG